MIEGYHPHGAANVRTLFSRQQFHALLAETGWEIVQEFRVDTSALQDGAWEVDLTLRDALPTINHLPSVRVQLRIQGGLLKTLAERPDIGTIPSYALTAQCIGLWEDIPTVGRREKHPG